MTSMEKSMLLDELFALRKADKPVCYDSDLSRLPKDAVVIKTFYKYSYELISYILEHKYQVVRYKRSDGKILEGYFPKPVVLIGSMQFPGLARQPIFWLMRVPSSCMHMSRAVTWMRNGCWTILAGCMLRKTVVASPVRLLKR